MHAAVLSQSQLLAEEALPAWPRFFAATAPAETLFHQKPPLAVHPMHRGVSRLRRIALALALAGAITLVDVRAQELNCTVRVNISKLSGSDYTFLQEFEQRVDEYLNQRRWTNDDYREFERIDCQVQINFEEALSLTTFRAGLVLGTRRPIYGTPQTTTVVQLRDDGWEFGYSQGTPLSTDQERYDPITSVLNFYVYLMLGYDYDTFSEFGGTPHFEAARRIAERAQSQNAQGWSEVGGNRGRLDLVTQLMEPTFRPLRQTYFNYHFGALDRFTREPEVARQLVYERLEALLALYELQGRTYAVDLFFNTKYTELAAIFMQSQLSNQAYALLSRLDSSHMSEYNKLVGQ